MIVITSLALKGKGDRKKESRLRTKQQQQYTFAVIASIIAVITLATSGAATQLAFAPGERIVHT
jgi:hypothetical protein